MFKPGKELYKIAAKACQKVYENNIDLGTTEFFLSTELYRGKIIQILSIAGSNEKRDWLKNFNPWSKKGIKKVAYDAAKEILLSKQFDKNRRAGFPLLICGHSKAGPTAIAFKLFFDKIAPSINTYCIAFAPARSLRYWSKDKHMQDTTLFIDPDDPVSKVGFISFRHPITHTIYAENDHLLAYVKDHFMDHWIEFVGNMKD